MFSATKSRLLLACLAGMTSGALLATSAHAVGAAGPPEPRRAAASEATPPLTTEQRQFIEDGMGSEALAEITKAMSEQPAGTGIPQTRAFPIAAAVIGAAAWCAKGAVASIPTSVLSDIAAGKASGKKTYVRNAILGCLGGEIGSWAWKVLPNWVKNKAVNMVIAFIIKYIR
ncbi:hypothetical protein [Streptomyces sp. TLI_146]|uniref:hypothetical protein n=1 Tax=Streptomyces sp. TLI_146 TaxID=1938858 RepID=UPI000C7033AB|nr:hypothetical protein [Streptomyces sp. TLI_146]